MPLGSMATGLACGLGNDARQPRSHGRADRLEVALEAVIATHLHHLASRTRRRHAEPIAFALNDQGRHCHHVELGQAALRRLAGASGRFEGESETEHGDSAGRRRGTASDAGTQRTTANDEWQAVELDGEKALEDGDPRGVELCALAGDRRPATRYGCSTSATAKPSASAAFVAATRSGASIPPAAPWPRTRAARDSREGGKWARARPCGVSISTTVTLPVSAGIAVRLLLRQSAGLESNRRWRDSQASFLSPRSTPMTASTRPHSLGSLSRT